MLTLNIRAIPNASKNEIVGWSDGALKIKVTAPPEDGKANKAITAFLAKELNVSKREISILSGQKSRNKKITIEGLTEAALAKQLGKA